MTFLSLLIVLLFALADADDREGKISKEDCTSAKLSTEYTPIDVLYDDYFDKCIIPAKGRCSSWGNVKCTQYAECRFANRDMRCRCKDYFSISEDGLGCVLVESIGGPCILNVAPDANGCDLRLGLECFPDENSGSSKKGKCGCGAHKLWNNVTSKCMPKDCSQRMRNAFYDPKSGNCYMAFYKEFQMEDMTNLFVTCPPGAEAKVNFPRRNEHYCACADTHTTIRERGDNECFLKKTYHESCQTVVVDEVCNQEQVLSCINGTCQCDQPGSWNMSRSTCNNERYCTRMNWNQFYDVETEKCMGTIGENVNLKVIDSDKPNRILECPKNAKSYPYPDDTGMCACNKGFKSSRDARSCVAKEDNSALPSPVVTAVG